ncbi:hypothetical protein LXL04_009713 [Taraxacum kok-saghyz]
MGRYTSPAASHVSLSGGDQSKRKRGDFATMLSRTETSAGGEARLGTGSKNRDMFRHAMQGVGVPMAAFGVASRPVMMGGVSSSYTGTTLGSTSAPTLLGFPPAQTGSWTSLTPCPTSKTSDIFRPLWGITEDANVLDSSYGVDFVSHVFPPATISRMEGMTTEELDRGRHNYMVQSMAYNLEADRRHREALEQANIRAHMASDEASEYKIRYEVAEKGHQEEYDRMVAQISTLQLQIASHNEIECQLSKSKEEMGWMLQEGIPESFDRAMYSPAFLENSKNLYQAYSNFGSEQARQDLREKYPLQIPDYEVPSGGAEALDRAMSVFATKDYVMSSGLDMSSYEAFRASLFPREKGGT